MTSRDQRLAAKYAAKGKQSASERNEERENRRSRVPDDAGGSVLDHLRSFNKDNPVAPPRSEESRRNAKAHKGSIGPLPPAS